MATLSSLWAVFAPAASSAAAAVLQSSSRYSSAELLLLGLGFSLVATFSCCCGFAWGLLLGRHCPAGLGPLVGRVLAALLAGGVPQQGRARLLAYRAE